MKRNRRETEIVALDLFRLANMLHEERLRESEKMRLYQRAALELPPFRERLLLRLGDLLIALGKQLKAYAAVHVGAHHPMNSLEL